MSQDLVVHGQQALTAADVKAQVQRIQEVMKHVMKKGEHYDIIPGCGSKMTLLKPGAEKILSTFGIAVEPEVEDLSGYDERRFRVKCVLYAGDKRIGAGLGECSSNEEKYRWKKPSCDEEYEATAEDRRRIKWYKGQSKSYEVKQVRTEPADVSNTILKMAKKRAMIDATLTATGASDIFEQDLEDVQIPDNGAPKPEPIQAPKPVGDKVPPVMTGTATAPTGPGDATEPQIKKINAMLAGKGVKDGYERHAHVSKILGFADVLESFTYLTKTMASTIIKALEESR